MVPAAAGAVLCGNLGLAPATGLTASLRPIEVGLGLGDDVLRVTALETLSVIAVHVPRQLQVSSAAGTCLELYHFACSVLSPQNMRIRLCVALSIHNFKLKSLRCIKTLNTPNIRHDNTTPARYLYDMCNR